MIRKSPFTEENLPKVLIVVNEKIKEGIAIEDIKTSLYNDYRKQEIESIFESLSKLGAYDLDPWWKKSMHYFSILIIVLSLFALVIWILALYTSIVSDADFQVNPMHNVIKTTFVIGTQYFVIHVIRRNSLKYFTLSLASAGLVLILASNTIFMAFDLFNPLVFLSHILGIFSYITVIVFMLLIIVAQLKTNLLIESCYSISQKMNLDQLLQHFKS